ncbi:TadE/TadG family type IV pilus assembly protein [Burkholderia guangdongensis]|uniref:TadE/TadG family type IV pilus assembly protein n=1 Tax=Burkholderia guangdongensis TaxID=1792500 RepID=UPI0015CCE8D0|nr:TadE family protein [Burkholderia guangdongensis]
MRGVAAVEFALVLIPLVLLVTGVAEFGRAIYQYETLTKATRDAARYLSVYRPSDTTTYPISDARCLVVYGATCDNAGTSPVPLVPGLTTSMVYICDSSNNPGNTSSTSTSSCTASLDPTDPAHFASVTTYDSTGAAQGSVNLVEVKIKGFSYQPIPAYPGMTAFSFGDIITVMRQVI